MQKHIIAAVCACSLALLCVWPSAARAASETDQDFIFKAVVEARLEERLKNALSEIAGTEKLIVIVNADVETDNAMAEKMRAARQQGRKKSSGLVLPGVPVKQEIGKEETLPDFADLPPSKIKRLKVIVLVGENLADELIDVMRDVTVNAVGYNPDRGDVIDIRQLEFTKKIFPWATLFHPPHLYYAILVMLGSLLAIAIATFFFNPYRNLSAALRNVTLETVHGTTAKGAEGESAEAGAESALISALEARAAEEDRDRPFAFVREKLLQELAYLLDKGSAEDAAVVVNYIPPELASKLLERFGQERQAEITMQLSKWRVIDPAKVKALEDSLKARLAYVVGGDSRIASILNMATDDVREMVLDRIGSEDPDAARRIRRKVKSFEDVLRELPANVIQAIYRQSDPTMFALTIMSTPGDIQKKVIDALSEGASERLQEEMRLSHPLSKARLRKEKNTILTLIRKMVHAGLIEEAVGEGGGE